MTVIMTASEKNHPWLYQLGADQVIDYHTVDFTEVSPKVDYVFDTIGKDTLLRSFQILKPGGKIVSVSGLPDERFAEEYGLGFLWRQIFKMLLLQERYENDRPHDYCHVWHDKFKKVR